MNCIVCGTENNLNKSKFCCKKCEQKYYYQINKEKRKEYKKEYYQANKEKCDRKHNDWVENNRLKNNEYQRNYYKKRKEMIEDGKID